MPNVEKTFHYPPTYGPAVLSPAIAGVRSASMGYRSIDRPTRKMSAAAPGSFSARLCAMSDVERVDRLLSPSKPTATRADRTVEAEAPAPTPAVVPYPRRTEAPRPIRPAVTPQPAAEKAAPK